MTHRKHSHAFGTITLAVTTCLLLWGFQLPASAGDTTQAEPLVLRKIMQEIGRNMQPITGAISQEEWIKVVQLAPKVAVRPEPPLTEKMCILAYLGADATKFRNFDAQTHKAAQASAVFYRLGEIRDRSFEQQHYRASGLNLVTAAIVLWNTVYLEHATSALCAHGEALDDTLLQYL